MTKKVRYQAAILRDREILLIQHHEFKDDRIYWLLPGGGIEVGETESQCVQREVKEETNLEVKVGACILDEPVSHEDEVYQRFKTYLCTPVRGIAHPGYEPEPEASEKYAITAVCWLDLYDEVSWSAMILNDPITAPLLRRLREAVIKLPGKSED